MKLIKNQKDLFTSYIDIDFENWNVDDGVETSGQELKTTVQTKDFTYKNVFNPNTDLVSQTDIIEYCKKEKFEELYKYHLFLTKNMKGELFVVFVIRVSVGLKVFVHEFGNDYMWLGERLDRVVTPMKVQKETLSNSDSLFLSVGDFTISLEELNKSVENCKKAGYQVSKIL